MRKDEEKGFGQQATRITILSFVIYSFKRHVYLPRYSFHGVYFPARIRSPGLNLTPERRVDMHTPPNTLLTPPGYLGNLPTTQLVYYLLSCLLPRYLCSRPRPWSLAFSFHTHPHPIHAFLITLPFPGDIAATYSRSTIPSVLPIPQSSS
ncbi:hypothetical protein LZ31DRAFT_359999 [Colletotrichum somersetense]|nr:hypothetical protein LZ31DRAFT_359999 [Colletotrichum somersetense]